MLVNFGTRYFQFFFFPNQKVNNLGKTSPQV